jgi:nucleoside-diphosphate-sugar epimerase
MRGLIGYTGFVGSNLLKQTTFDELYNSKNINEIKGKKFDYLICAGAPAVKWKANKFPDEDLANIQSLMSNLKEIECNEFILISTVDVYPDPTGATENTEINLEVLQPYGKHRLMLEQFVLEQYPKVTIVRLPGLFGPGLKKNIIYDFIHNNCIDMINSENVFQFYNLERLYMDIKTVRKNGISLVNFATEPVSVKEVAAYAFDLEFSQTTENGPVYYDMKTLYSKVFHDHISDYIASRQDVLGEIRQFVQNELKQKEKSSL